MVIRRCDSCNGEYEAKRASSKYCGEKCRKRAQRKRTTTTAQQAAEPADKRSSVTAATRKELERAALVDSALGRAALVLAARIDLGAEGADTGAAIAAMTRELRATMEALLKTTKPATDPVDELARQRERRRRGA